VVVLTNYPTQEMRRRCLALGADAVFDKSNELEAFFEYCSSLRSG
jgi:DNA-binding NarL/FixJ family response regulator